MQAHAGSLLPSVPHCALRLHSMMMHVSLRTLSSDVQCHHKSSVVRNLLVGKLGVCFL